MRKLSRAQSDRGAALLESLIAILLLSIGIASQLHAISIAIQELAQTTWQNRAMHINANLVAGISELPAAALHADDEIYAGLLQEWQIAAQAQLPVGRAHAESIAMHGLQRHEFIISWQGGRAANAAARPQARQYLFRSMP